MKFRITYHCKRFNEQHTIEWVAPKYWSQSEVQECFEQRYPTATVLVIRAIP